MIEITHRFTGVVIKTVDAGNLSDANLSGADLSGANLSGAKYGDITIKSVGCFSGLYRYLAMPIVADDGKKYIRLGCYIRTVDEWGGDFWNNPTEFPNDGSEKSQARWFAYQTCLRWLEGR
jgi:hypothetical protein